MMEYNLNITHVISGIPIKGVSGRYDSKVSKVCTNSKDCIKDSLFIAIPGEKVDGRNFIEDAISRGATCIVSDIEPTDRPWDVTYVTLRTDARYAAARAFANFYRVYSISLFHVKVVGVTGTNGKTTTATLLYRLFRKLGYKVGLISTVANYINDTRFEASNTTPEPAELYKLLSDMRDAHCEYCFMEVSSHALSQYRTAGIIFKGAIFTNLTRDHLDYHKTFEAYRDAKKMFFDNLERDAFALVNEDDKNGKVMLQNTEAKKHTYSLKSFSDFKCKIIEEDFNGMQLLLDDSEVWVNFIGQFNAYNLLAVYSAARLLGVEKNDLLPIISTLVPVDGRFECIRSANGIMGIVDYAHTPDALENVLSTILQIRTNKEQVITVVGAGGDRDKGKRPMMANVAARLSDKLIITSDNPRSEDPAVIAEEMKVGVDAVDSRKVMTIIDRREAIRAAVMMAKPKDIILVAGKGHEDYQIVKGVKSHFDDREELRKIFDDLK